MLPLLFACFQLTHGCAQTLGTTPITTTESSSTTDCCPALTQTLTSSSFPDGSMTFAYNSDTCRTTVTATCVSTDTSLGLYAAIVANTDQFLDYGENTVSFPGTCTDGDWYMGTPSLQIETLECILTNPPSGK
ncbi:unnamed protein product [Caenorhabditis angaria]|uniref:C6 domain-containing protein n=1 Tax=Caenorhabditis angaria TaxID=860376 RepID=A0A9P1INK5_9PELO|nr:unnamed protein product [Caenorhabditis angaria]